MKKKLLTAASIALGVSLTASAQTFESRRPVEGERLFTSEKIEQVIDEVTAQLTNPKLATASRTRSTRRCIFARTKTAIPTHSSTPATSTLCGCAIPEPKSGLMCSSLLKMSI